MKDLIRKIKLNRIPLEEKLEAILNEHGEVKLFRYAIENLDIIESYYHDDDFDPTEKYWFDFANVETIELNDDYVCVWYKNEDYIFWSTIN